jgi:hypothetical protein
LSLAQVNIQSTADNKVTITDSAGAPITWINRIMIELDDISKQQTLFFGTTSFSVNIQAGPPPATAPATPAA